MSTTTMFDAIFKVDYSQVDKASEAVKNLGTANKGTSDAAEHMSTIFGSMGGVVGEASSHLQHFTSTAKEVISALEGLAAVNVANIAGLEGFASTLLYTAGVVTGFVAILGTIGVMMAESWGAKIEEASHLGTTFGLTASQAFLMSDAAKDAGSSLEKLEMSYAKVAKSAYMANDETKGMGAAFHTMGVETKDASGELRSAKDLTDELITKWEEGTKTTADFAAMQTVLGKKFLEVVMVRELVIAAEQIATEQQKLGIGITNEAQKAMHEQTLANIEMKGVMSDVGSYLVEAVIPAWTNLVQWFNKSYEAGGLVYGMFNILVTATQAVMVVFKELGTILVGFDFVFTAIGKAIGATAASLMMLAKGDVSGAGNVWSLYLEDVKKNADSSATSMHKFWEETTGHTVAKPTAGIGDEAGGDPKPKKINNRTIAMESAPALPTDPYLAYSNALIKAQESLDHVSESTKVQTQLDVIDAAQLLKHNEILQKNSEIAKFNSDNQAKINAGTANAKKPLLELDDALVQNEKTKIRQQAVDADTTKNLTLQTTQYTEIDKMVTQYTQSVAKRVEVATKSKESIAGEIEVEKLLIQADKDVLAIMLTKYPPGEQQIDQMNRANAVRAKVVVAIEQVNAATKQDNSAAELRLQTTQYAQLDDMVKKYSDSINFKIKTQYLSSEAIADGNEKLKIQEQLDKDVLQIMKDKGVTDQNDILVRQQILDLQAKAATATDLVTAATKRGTDAQKDFVGNGIASFVQGLGTMEQGLTKIVSGSLTSFSDTLYTLVTTGKNGFKDMVATMIEQIAKLIFQMYVVIPIINQMKASMSSMGGLGSLFGGLFGGGAAAGTVNATGWSAEAFGMFADGGDPPVNKISVVGEHGPELFIPRGAGSIIPNNQLGTATNATTISNNFQINVTGATDPAATAQQVATQVKQLQQLADSRIASQLRPGGMLNRHSTQAF